MVALETLIDNDNKIDLDTDLHFYKNQELSEEIIQKGYEDHGLKIGKYQFYNIGSTTISTLKKYKIIPNEDYKEYEKKRPDALLVDRRNKSKPSVITVIEYKSPDEFKTKKQKKEAVEQGNNYAQILKVKISIATDKSTFIWFNPNHDNKENEYLDKTTNKKRSYTIITDENSNNLIDKFVIKQTSDESDLSKLEPDTNKSIKRMDFVKSCISSNTSKLLVNNITTDPTDLAKQIWQDVWSISGATPEKCLYTFIELFIFKYLSDLKILDKDEKGNKINFKDIFDLEPLEAFKNYSSNVRPFLKTMFPLSNEDGTTIINGTVLNSSVPEHSIVFHKILKKFNIFGELKNIDPSFKTKVFEQFMKESISTKNWGRYFTPRSIVDSMIEISDIDKLAENSKICDPACGVGGFILEPIKVKKDGLNFYYKIKGNQIKAKHQFFGFDKGFDKEEQLTIILAKANMLIFLSELLKDHSNLSEKFSELFNSTFKLLTNSILGTLSMVNEDQYDLIITNPPYVTSGSSNYKDAIKNDKDLNEFYKISAMGVEGLFLEWIIRSLKPSKKAFVIVPDGLLQRTNDKSIRSFLKKECVIDGIISLPSKAFYTTLKQTYILCITKKSETDYIERENNKQTEPVFTYLISDIGETLDVNRFSIPENDLKNMVPLFNQFKGAKERFQTSDKRCKIQPIDKFDPIHHWCIDRWWTKEEKQELGIEDEESIMTIKEFTDKVFDLDEKLHQLKSQLKKLE